VALTFDWANKVVESDASITDLPVFHAALRDAEDDELGMLFPTIHTWRALDLGGGAFFYACDFINGWRLKFTPAGNYTIQGNLNAEIIPVANVYVERKTSAAYATTAVGGSGPSAADIAAALLAALGGAPVPVDVRYVNGVQITGAGVPGADPWRPA
jgi:hypothetical protein